MAERKAERSKADVLPAATIKAVTDRDACAKTLLQRSQAIFSNASTADKLRSFRRAK